jgi:hypothetical protein
MGEGSELTTLSQNAHIPQLLESTWEDQHIHVVVEEEEVEVAAEAEVVGVDTIEGAAAMKDVNTVEVDIVEEVVVVEVGTTDTVGNHLPTKDVMITEEDQDLGLIHLADTIIKSII